MGIAGFKKYDDRVRAAVGITEEAFDELMKGLDEPRDYQTKIRKEFYVLRERPEGQEEWIRIKDLKKALMAGAEQKRSLTALVPLPIPVEGSYFPDYLEEKGHYFVSLRLWEYLRKKLVLNKGVFTRRVQFVTEGRKRAEEYCLLNPEEVDCVLLETARRNRSGVYEYLEIEDEKTGDLQIMKVKGFPHLVVTEKLNRVDFAGFECCRAENYFAYEDERDRNYRERLNGKRLEESQREVESRAGGRNFSFKAQIKRILDKEQLGQEIREGMRSVFDSYRGRPFKGEKLSDRIITFYFRVDKERIELVTNYQIDFGVTAFSLPSLGSVMDLCAKQEGVLQTAVRQMIVETVLHLISKECRLFDDYENIHGNERFRLYLGIEKQKTVNLPMVYDYKSHFQREVEKANDLSCYDLSNLDLREFDFSGKDLSQIKFAGCNLRRAKFHGACLTLARFTGCELKAVDFRQSLLRSARFEDCSLEWARFEEADLRGAVLAGDNFRHTVFINSDLTKARLVSAGDLFLAYFYRSNLQETVFQVPQRFYDNVFRICDLRNALFCGGEELKSAIMFHCDFSNSDLSKTKFQVEQIKETSFTKAKLYQASFAPGARIQESIFRWAACQDLELTGVILAENDFSYVDLSRLRTKKGSLFMRNKFYYAKLSGYDFRERGYNSPNDLAHADLSDCRLEGADLTTSNLMDVNLKNAKLKGAALRSTQIKAVKLSVLQQRMIRVVLKGEDV